MSLVKLSIILAAAAYQDAEPIEIPQLAPPPRREAGLASWYGDGRLHGNTTASGEPLDPTAFTCAHRTLPLQTTVLLVNRKQPDRRVWCRINDRGPYGVDSSGDYRSILDVSVSAARALGTHGRGRQPIAIHYWTRHRSRSRLAVATSLE